MLVSIENEVRNEDRYCNWQQYDIAKVCEYRRAFHWGLLFKRVGELLISKYRFIAERAKEGNEIMHLFVRNIHLQWSTIFILKTWMQVGVIGNTIAIMFDNGFERCVTTVVH